jgi:putative drug exporter of the RND superfamily
MAHLLQRLGRLSFRRRRTVLGVWIGLLIASAAAAGLAGGSFTSNFSVPGTESQKANDVLAQKLPATKGATGRIVFAAPKGQQLTGPARQTVQATLTTISHSAGVASVTNPFTSGTVSKTARIAYADIRFTKSQADLTDTQRTPIADAAAKPKAAGLQVGVTGDAAPPTSSAGAGEGVGILIAFLVLAITFGSLLTAGMPLLTAVLGVGIGLTGIVTAAAVTDLSSAVISLASMLGLAVGIDYALFIISRYRTLARRGIGLEAAAGQAVGTAGTAVVFAGSTVIIALAALLVAGVPFMTAMGLAAAGTVALAVLIAITLVPALLGFAGPRALKGKRSARAEAKPTTTGLRWVGHVMRFRRTAIGLVTVAALILASPVMHMHLGLPDDSSKPAGTPQRIAGDLLTEGFGQGFNGQLTIVAQLPKGSDGKAAAATIRTRVAKLQDVHNVTPGAVTPDGTTAIITLTPSSGPSSTATKDLVRAIRDQRTTITSGTQADIAVTGQTAVNIDVADKMGQSLVPYLAVIVGLAFLLLMIAFRSILVPLTAVGGFLLSVGAALGAMVAVFQDGTGASLIGVSETAPIVSLTPVMIIGILFGLAMDYQVFLVSGMKEAHARGANHHEAVRHGFRHSARVVTAAGLIMIGVFSGFILPDDPIIKSIGFTLAAGILIDAFLIRMTLIPALMSVLGERAWYMPRPLHRAIPNVDIEGASLEREARPHAPQPLPQPA